MPGAREIFRRDQRRVARVTARIAPDSDFPRAMAAAQRALDASTLPPGLRVRLAGEEEERVRTFGELKFAEPCLLEKNPSDYWGTNCWVAASFASPQHQLNDKDVSIQNLGSPPVTHAVACSDRSIRR